jgi:hypothetical protein
MLVWDGYSCQSPLRLAAVAKKRKGVGLAGGHGTPNPERRRNLLPGQRFERHYGSVMAGSSLS